MLKTELMQFKSLIIFKNNRLSDNEEGEGKHQRAVPLGNQFQGEQAKCVEQKHDTSRAPKKKKKCQPNPKPWH